MILRHSKKGAIARNRKFHNKNTQQKLTLCDLFWKTGFFVPPRQNFIRRIISNNFVLLLLFRFLSIHLLKSLFSLAKLWLIFSNLLKWRERESENFWHWNIFVIFSFSSSRYSIYSAWRNVDDDALCSFNYTIVVFPRMCFHMTHRHRKFQLIPTYYAAAGKLLHHNFFYSSLNF